MSVWVAPTTAGALASQAIPDPKGLGMDFAFTAAFIAIALSLFRGRADVAPWTVSLAVGRPLGQDRLARRPLGARAWRSFGRSGGGTLWR